MALLKKITAFFFASVPLLIPLLARADCTPNGTALCNPLGYTSLTTFLQKLLEIVAQIGFPVIVLMIVYVGFLFISAEGNPDKLKKARSFFLWTVVGAMIILGAQALSYAIQATVDNLKQGV